MIARTLGRDVGSAEANWSATGSVPATSTAASMVMAVAPE